MKRNRAEFDKETNRLDRILKLCRSVIANKSRRKPSNLEH